jgi:hypothetical protein
MSVSQSSSLMPLHSLARLPTALREPWGASVTLWEATAPVKLPTRHCPLPGFHGRRLELQQCKGGISTTAQRELAPPLQSLPPILHIHNQNPMPSYSKAPRGLSVLLWVLCIFTETTISPSLSSRQRTDRYSIRAGRNLPDKEFRYLRTVIVTAAVYRGFGLALLRVAPNDTTP